MDALSAFEQGFRAELSELWRRHRGLADVPLEDAERLGRAGAQSAVAPILWRDALGEVWDTARVTEMLGVSRQALAQRVRSGSMLGLRGNGTTLFPSWQFDTSQRAVRPIVAALLAEFRSAEGVEAWTIASWAMTPQTELRGQTPAELLSKDESAEYDVLAAARHTAARLAQ
jgi:hypothetical protein